MKYKKQKPTKEELLKDILLYYPCERCSEYCDQPCTLYKSFHWNLNRRKRKDLELLLAELQTNNYTTSNIINIMKN